MYGIKYNIDSFIYIDLILDISLLDDNTDDIMKHCILLAWCCALFPEFPISFPHLYVNLGLICISSS